MTDKFIFAKLSSKHKVWFVLHKTLLMATIGGLTYWAIDLTNPEIVTSGDKMSLTIGAIVGIFIGVLAYANRLKGILKIKFVGFALAWVLLSSLQMIMPTLIMTIGMVLTPLMVDDLILTPVWNSLWYNQYER